MIVFYDANAIYTAGNKAMQGSRFKYATQKYRVNQLVETARLCKELESGDYEPGPGTKFPINERGHSRFITSSSMRDKTINHVICDEVLTPATTKYLIYDNGASQKGKGVAFHRKRFEAHLHKYFMKHHSNEGFIALADFSGYYANIPHELSLEIIDDFIGRSFDDETREVAMRILRKIYKHFEIDVSRFSDEEIAELTSRKIDPMINYKVPKRYLTGQKILRLGVDIGSQPSQNIGIVHPYRVDNYMKIVRGVKGYGRYTDDTYFINPMREAVVGHLEGFAEESAKYGLIINRKKTHITKLSVPFRHLQVQYCLTDTGRVTRRINPKGMTRERRKLKAYRRLLDVGRIQYADVENAFKSWLGGHYKYMSHRQIYTIATLYYQLFKRRPKWKRKHSRLFWLMTHASKTWNLTATTTLAA